MFCHTIVLFLTLAGLIRARVFNATFNLGSLGGLTLYTIDTAYNPISAPSAGDTVTAGTTYPVRWLRTTNEFIEFKLFVVDQNEVHYTYAELEFNVAAGTPGNYDWSVAKTVPSGQNYILLSNSDGISPIFNIKNSDVPAATVQSASTLSSTLSFSSTTTASGNTKVSSTSTSMGTVQTMGSTSSSGTGNVSSQTGGSNSGGKGELTSEAKIGLGVGLGVGILFGIIATVIGVIQIRIMLRKRSGG